MTRRVSAHDFAGQRVLVTGAAKGIGAGITRAFVEAGAKVSITFRTSEAAAAALGEELGVEIHRADLSIPTEIDRILGAVGAVDVLVNNAGIYPLQPFLQMSDADWEQTRRINLDAVFGLTRRMASQLTADGRTGSIVNISSVEAHAPGALHAHYSTTKAAVEMMTRAAAQELGPHGIRVNAVAPGLIDYPELEGLWPEGVARWRARCPLGRLGQASDVAEAVLFLASPAADFITGTTLVVDGGMLTMPCF